MKRFPARIWFRCFAGERRIKAIRFLFSAVKTALPKRQKLNWKKNIRRLTLSELTLRLSVLKKTPQRLKAKVSVCAGATVDFLAGNVKRAPRWMSNHGLEWLYRFFKEPARLFKRYFIDDIKIFRLARKYKPGRNK